MVGKLFTEKGERKKTYAINPSIGKTFFLTCIRCSIKETVMVVVRILATII